MGGKTSTSTNTVSVPPEVLARYNAVNKTAETAAATPFQKYGTQASDFVAQMNEQQGRGIAGINAAADNGPIYNNIEKYLNPFTKNVADTTRAQMSQAQDQAQSGALGTAISSGAFGGDRAGVAAANLANQNQLAMGSTMANIYNQGYTQAVDTSMQDANRMLGISGQQIAAGTMQQQTEQAGKEALINQFMQEKGYPFQVAQFLANIALGTGVASGNTTTTTQPVGIFGNLYKDGGKVEGYASGGVAGPRSFTQTPIGGEGYVPIGDLPVGQMMQPNTPDQKRKDNSDMVMKLAMKAMEMNTGGSVGDRHGYATDGYVGPESPEEAYARYLSGKKSVPDYAETLLSKGVTGGTDAVSQLMPPPTPQRVSAVLQGPAETPSLGSVPQIPSPPREIAPQSVVLQGPSETPTLGSVPQIPSPPQEGGLAPSAVVRPPARPQGLAGANVVADTMTTLGRTAPAAPAVNLGNGSAMVDTGNVTSGQANHIVPLSKQIDFMVQEPEFQRYLSHDYSSAADAATGMDQYYEISGGQGRDRAAIYANDVYKAAQSGDMSNLPPNAQVIYKSLIDRGIDPIKASGVVGRLMVESYAHIDPNARNTLGGGNGTYGIAQWRGPRMKALSEFSGVPIDAITGAPVSTPEGRYYSSGVAGSKNQSAPQITSEGLAGANTQGDEKAYADRNAIGKFFHNETGRGLNPIALKSILGGLATMAKTNTLSPISALLQGVGGGMETYNRLQNEEPQRVANILKNNQDALLQYQTAKALDPNVLPFEQWAANKFKNGPASMIGGGNGVASNTQSNAPSYMGVPLDISGRGLSMNIPLPDGSGSIKADQSYAYLTQLKAEASQAAAAGVPLAQNTLTMVNDRLAAIEKNQGKVQTTDGRIVDDPTYTSTAFGTAQMGADFTRSGEIYNQLPSMQKEADSAIRTNEELSHALSNSAGSGPFAKFINNITSTAAALGIDSSKFADNYQLAYKVLGQEAANSLSDIAGKTDTGIYSGFLQAGQPTPEMAPGAIEEILAIRQGTAKFKSALAQALSNASQSGQENLAKVERDFAAEHPLSEFVEAEKPNFKGIIPRPSEMPEEGSTSTSRGKPIIFTNGKWEEYK